MIVWLGCGGGGGGGGMIVCSGDGVRYCGSVDSCGGAGGGICGSCRDFTDQHNVVVQFYISPHLCTFLFCEADSLTY